MTLLNWPTAKKTLPYNQQEAKLSLG